MFNYLMDMQQGSCIFMASPN